MKNIKWIFVIFLFIQSILFLRAEDYKPMILEGNRWNEGQYYNHGGWAYPVSTSYWIMGDTVLDGILYKKLYGHSSLPDISDGLRSYLREDTGSRKIFVRDGNIVDNEYILYDFGMQPGDTIEIPLYVDFPVYLIAKSVDTITINNKSHRRLKIESKTVNWANEGGKGYIHTWIEGIGGESGLFTSNYPHSELLGSAPVYLLCFYKEDSFYYRPEKTLFTEFKECYIEYYYPMIRKGNRWNILETVYYGALETSVGKTSVLTADDADYTRVYRSTDSLGQTRELIGVLEENRITRKVYWSTEGDPKYLLYDFDVVAGDIIKTYNYDYKTNTIELGKPVDIIVESVDSVFIDNTYRKRVNIKSKFTGSVTDEFTHYTWIEGIGGTNGLLTSFQPKTENDTISYDLLCYYENEELIYQPETGYPDCFIWEPGLGISVGEIVSFSIVFDHRNKTLRLYSGCQTKYTVELFDLQGRSVFSGIYHLPEVTIDLSAFPSGIYLVKAVSASTAHTAKIVHR